jgi:hypothetical protein
MCHDFRIFQERTQKQAEDARLMQERRVGVIDKLLDDANKKSEDARPEGALAKDVAPVK